MFFAEDMSELELELNETWVKWKNLPLTWMFKVIMSYNGKLLFQENDCFFS